MAISVRIEKQTKCAVQSGKAKTKTWVLTFPCKKQQKPDPLMGWVGGSKTSQQLNLSFDTLEEAKAYAESKGYKIEVVEASPKAPSKPKSYASNFVQKTSWD